MGNIISNIATRFKFLRVALQQLLASSESYERLLKRIEASPGLPVIGPTVSFWMDELSTISAACPKALPGHADVVIIGSGITGTAVARTLLKATPGCDDFKVVMLEARGACSGATGRNGGHVKPPLYHDYGVLKKKYGQEHAEKIIRFRLAHFKELQRVASEDDILKEAQCRQVDSLDVHFSAAMFEDARRELAEWKRDMPIEANDTVWIGREEAIDRFHISPLTCGVIYNHAGAMHPYRFVTSILEKLLSGDGNRFLLSTYTPCTSVQAPTPYQPYYLVETPNGIISTPHVVHATNAWLSHLLVPMRTKVFPVRGNMTAQRPGKSLFPASLNGHRSWVFYHQHTGYDYLTQLPNGENELMFGGGFFQGGNDNGLGELGNTDDTKYNAGIASHLTGSLSVLFGEGNWGAEAEPRDTGGKWHDGRAKALWSGIIGLSVDGLPWVGKLPPKLTGRAQPTAQSAGDGDDKCDRDEITATPGEWLAAGYSGEGMAHAYLCGKALAYMILDEEDKVCLSEWFPGVMRVSEERWKRAEVEDLLDNL